MKKLLALLAPLTFALTACVAPTATTTPSTTNSLAMMAVKVGVQATCVAELDENTYWNTASSVLSETQKQSYETEVCSCVAEKATTNINAADLVIAAMDKTTQVNLASKIVAQTLNACVVETFKN